MAYRPLTSDDLVIIGTCFMDKGWQGARICCKFPDRKWNPCNVNYAIKHLKTSGSILRLPTSGRPRTALTEQKIAEAEELVFSQEDKPGTHTSARETARRPTE